MRILNTAIKMALACLIASLIAQFLGFQYWITSGVIAVLSIQLTKKDSFTVAIKRSLDAILGLLGATLFFVVFGYHFWVFSIFVLVFAYASFKLKIQEGIVPVLVLVTHLMAFGTFSLSLLLEEFAIMFIAVGVVLLFDLFYPISYQKEFNEHTKEIDRLLADHIFMFSLLLKDKVVKSDCEIHYQKLSERMAQAIQHAKLLDKDLLFQNDHSYLSYLEMRNAQKNHVNHMYQHATKIETSHPFILEIAYFVEQLSYDIGYYDKASGQLEKLNTLKLAYKKSDLPKTRPEFETRAMLYQIVNEIEYLLKVKIAFHQKYPQFVH